MMKRLFALAIGFAILSSVRAHSLSAQSVAESLAALRSDAPTTRMAGLDSLSALSRRLKFPLCSPQASREVKQGLVAGLQKENYVVHSAAPGSMDEDEADEYYGNLIGCVASLREPGAIPELLAAIGTGGGAMGGLAVLGDAAVPGLLAVVDSTPRQRYPALATLARMASGENGISISARNRDAIRARALRALSDKSGFVRSAGIEALMSYSDPEVRRMIKSVATAALADGQLGPGQRDGIVLDRARAWLKQDELRASRPRP